MQSNIQRRMATYNGQGPYYSLIREGSTNVKKF